MIASPVWRPPPGLVHASVREENERAAGCRLSVLALFAPLLLAVGLVQTLAEPLGASRIVALVALVIAVGWLAGLLLGSPEARAEELALLGILTAAQCRDRCRCRRSFLAAGAAHDGAARSKRPGCGATARGLFAGAAGIAGGACLCRRHRCRCSTVGPNVATKPGTGWCRPLWLATVVVRAAVFVGERERDAEARRPVAAEDVIDAVVLRLAKGGEVLDVGGKAEALLEPAAVAAARQRPVRPHPCRRPRRLAVRAGGRCATARSLRKLELRLRAAAQRRR